MSAQGSKLLHKLTEPQLKPESKDNDDNTGVCMIVNDLYAAKHKQSGIKDKAKVQNQETVLNNYQD